MGVKHRGSTGRPSEEAIGVPAGSVDRPGCPLWGPGLLSAPHLLSGPGGAVALRRLRVHTHTTLRILLPSFQESFTGLGPSLASQALGSSPPWPPSKQVLHVCSCLGDRLPWL